jgi:hypothetical protein
MSIWETPSAIKSDFGWIKDYVHCFIAGHDYDTDEYGYSCQRCFHGVMTDTIHGSYEEAFENRPYKRSWRKFI